MISHGIFTSLVQFFLFLFCLFWFIFAFPYTLYYNKVNIIMYILIKISTMTMTVSNLYYSVVYFIFFNNKNIFELYIVNILYKN